MSNWKEMIAKIPKETWARVRLELELTEALAQMMEREQVTPEELAAQIGVSRRQMSRVMCESKPSIRLMARVMAHLGYSLKIEIVKEEEE